MPKLLFQRALGDKSDLVPNDPWGYRVAIAESFRKLAILPEDLPTFGKETLLWRGPESDSAERLFQHVRKELERLDDLIHLDGGPGQRAVPKPGAREQSFNLTRKTRRELHDKMLAYILRLPTEQRDVLSKEIGLDLSGDRPSFEVHTIALAERQGPDGRMTQQFGVTLVQSHPRPTESSEIVELLSGSTVLLQRSDHSVRYIIRKRSSEKRLNRNMAFALAQIADENPYSRVSPNQRFALIHESGG